MTKEKTKTVGGNPWGIIPDFDALRQQHEDQARAMQQAQTLRNAQLRAAQLGNAVIDGGRYQQGLTNYSSRRQLSGLEEELRQAAMSDPGLTQMQGNYLQARGLVGLGSVGAVEVSEEVQKHRAAIIGGYLRHGRPGAERENAEKALVKEARRARDYERLTEKALPISPRHLHKIDHSKPINEELRAWKQRWLAPVKEAVA